MSCAAHGLAASRRFLVAEDVDLIGEAVAMLPVNRWVNVVDLGAGSGTTALSVFAKRSHDLNVLTIDHSVVALESTGECMKNAGYHLLWTPVLDETAGALGLRANRGAPVDLLLIDANHEYEGVAADLKAWLPLVRPGAPVWLHDMTSEYPGVKQAVDEAVAKGALAVVKAAGWGVLCEVPVAKRVLMPYGGVIGG